MKGMVRFDPIFFVRICFFNVLFFIFFIVLSLQLHGTRLARRTHCSLLLVLIVLVDGVNFQTDRALFFRLQLGLIERRWVLGEFLVVLSPFFIFFRTPFLRPLRTSLMFHGIATHLADEDTVLELVHSLFFSTVRTRLLLMVLLVFLAPFLLFLRVTFLADIFQREEFRRFAPFRAVNTRPAPPDDGPRIVFWCTPCTYSFVSGNR